MSTQELGNHFSLCLLLLYFSVTELQENQLKCLDVIQDPLAIQTSFLPSLWFYREILSDIWVSNSCYRLLVVQYSLKAFGCQYRLPPENAESFKFWKSVCQVLITHVRKSTPAEELHHYLVGEGKKRPWERGSLLMVSSVLMLNIVPFSKGVYLLWFCVLLWHPIETTKSLLASESIALFFL